MIEVSSGIFTYLKKIFNEKIAEEYVDFIGSKPSQYIRINRLKTSQTDLTKSLFNTYGIESEPIPGIPGCLKVLKGEEKTGKTIQHIIGDYYIQSLSSMLPPLSLDADENDTVLDLCSAPGSKTTQIGEMMKNQGTLVANEIALDRVKMLVFNIDRMNLINAGVIHSKGELLNKIYQDHFDKILVDAPCSGLGIIQKKNEVSNWWSLERISVLEDLQLRLLIAAIKMVKTGGEIVYSTCTLTVEENELIINKVLEKYPVEIIDLELPVKSHPAFNFYEGKRLNSSLSKAHRILPWEINSDGFFIVKLRKTGKTAQPELLKPVKQNLKLMSSEKKEIQILLNNIIKDFAVEKEVFKNFNFLAKGKDIFFINKNWDEKNLDIFNRIGTRFGTIDKNGKTVLHTQAAQILNNEIKKNIYEIENTVELETYLSGGTIKKEIENTGQCIVKYRDLLLGTAVNTKQGIKSRFPRAKRTQEILIEA
ncbi:MAG: NOL1/NOP2/sun family putative RNA methylase [Ignavibacteriaceae bacterium]